VTLVVVLPPPLLAARQPLRLETHHQTQSDEESQRHSNGGATAAPVVELFEPEDLGAASSPGGAGGEDETGLAGSGDGAGTAGPGDGATDGVSGAEPGVGARKLHESHLEEIQRRVAAYLGAVEVAIEGVSLRVGEVTAVPRRR
jgi:hypothetical protein